MNAQPSTWKVLGLVVLAMLLGGLLFAQQSDRESVSSPSPSDSKASPEVEAGTADFETLAEKEAASENARAEDAVPQSPEKRRVSRQDVIASLTIFVLAIFVGFEVITKVPPTLHTPLMSGSNAISGITLVGAVIVAASLSFSGFIGLLAVTLATINVVGGFLVTHRMLSMFRKR